MNPRNSASEGQVQAARPDVSTWLSANAGSGKTKVLTDRVARLLLAGTEPQNILCLTYTKAAASEMQNRLFRRLGAWAMLDDRQLAQELDVLGADYAPDDGDLRHARTLFARAIEAPGGLRIQTIHSFCAALLRRFPLEAGVSPDFTQIEDRAAKSLRAQVIDDIANGSDRAVIEDMADYVRDFDFDSIASEILRHRERFAAPLRDGDLFDLFGVPLGLDEDSLAAEVFIGGEEALLGDLVRLLREGSSRDTKGADNLAPIGAPDVSALPVLERVFLFGEKSKMPFQAKIDDFPTKLTRSKNPALIDDLNSFMERVERACPLRRGLLAVRKARTLHRFARVFLPEYEKRKQLRGWLDFDDQIQKARQLLNDPDVAAWVLYRLDGGIDHILVDEAQDTSPAQWDVIDKLAQEFSSGQGARQGITRTIFVVGDKKQSIYSFQGADADEFDRMRTHFKKELTQAGAMFQERDLEFSFRSAGSLLQLVDRVFEGRADAGFDKNSQHRAFESELPGRIDVWPIVPVASEPDPPSWTDPVDHLPATHHNIVLAERIAASIKKMIDDKETIPVKAGGKLARRAVTAGDFLILVKTRTGVFGEIIRACKALDLPIAGADRLRIGAELAVRDLAALLRFLATPEDDLSLACALKSPLFGWSEQALFSLAHDRGEKFLWQALRECGDLHPKTLAIIADLRDAADFLRPFDLIERILNRHGGRQNLLGRLGAEAEDGINALLAQALAYERTDIPGLTGFIGWMELMEEDKLEFKRQLGSANGMIRVMTVHGAKGLESPIVILPDTMATKTRRPDNVLEFQGVPVWRPSAADFPPQLIPAREDAKSKARKENQRLLYVALTRAETRLIVAGAGQFPKEEVTWYQAVEKAAIDLGAVPRAFPGGQGYSIEDAAWNQLPLIEPETPRPDTVDLPPCFLRPAKPGDDQAGTISPSDLGGAKALPGAEGDTTQTALDRGTAIHLLLEKLPETDQARWPETARSLLAGAGSLDVEGALNEATAILNDKALSHLFADGALAEVPVTAEIGGKRIHGTIDRLIIGDGRVLAVDFKSNATLPNSPEQCPEGILRQMAAYVLALEQIYPDCACRCAILWTRTGELMHLPHDLVMAAGYRTPHLDLTRNGS